MQDFNAFWRGQDKRRLVILAGAALVTFLAVWGLTRLATAPRMELLFARLEPAAASEVVDSLAARGVAYEVRGDAIYVDGARRDALRMQLAGEGIPALGGAGYEILDGLSGFGTTSQMFDAAYWRAREGELTRTILATPGVKQARVHLATADASPFARDRSATASVTLQMASGAVGTTLARAVQSLVSGAVRDLAPEDVTVIDAATGRVVGGGAVDTEAEARDRRVAEMRAGVENLLAAKVGRDRFVVELALETTRDRETIRERILDPESRVVISTDTEERTASDQGGAGQGVTVASNLPDGDAEGGGEGRQSQSAETRERVNFDFSATERQVERAPGAVERITVAVLVDGVREAGEDGVAEWAPRPQDELEAIRELVQSAVGFDADRGDVVTVRTMRFDLPSAPEAAPGLSLPWFTGGQLTQLGIAALLAITAIAVAAFVIRPLLSKGGASSAPSATGLSAPDGAAPVGSAAGVGNLLAPPAVPDASPSTTVPGALPSPTEAPPNFAPAISLAGLDDLPSDGSATSEDDPVDRLRQLISERREETLEVLRGWMDDKPEDAR